MRGFVVKRYTILDIEAQRQQVEDFFDSEGVTGLEVGIVHAAINPLSQSVFLVLCDDTEANGNILLRSCGTQNVHNSDGTVPSMTLTIPDWTTEYTTLEAAYRGIWSGAEPSTYYRHNRLVDKRDGAVVGEVDAFALMAYLDYYLATADAAYLGYFTDRADALVAGMTDVDGDTYTGWPTYMYNTDLTSASDRSGWTVVTIDPDERYQYLPAPPGGCTDNVEPLDLGATGYGGPISTTVTLGAGTYTFSGWVKDPVLDWTYVTDSWTNAGAPAAHTFTLNAPSAYPLAYSTIANVNLQKHEERLEHDMAMIAALARFQVETGDTAYQSTIEDLLDKWAGSLHYDGSLYYYYIDGASDPYDNWIQALAAIAHLYADYAGIYITGYGYLIFEWIRDQVFETFEGALDPFAGIPIVDPPLWLENANIPGAYATVRQVGHILRMWDVIKRASGTVFVGDLSVVMPYIATAIRAGAERIDNTGTQEAWELYWIRPAERPVWERTRKLIEEVWALYPDTATCLVDQITLGEYLSLPALLIDFSESFNPFTGSGTAVISSALTNSYQSAIGSISALLELNFVSGFSLASFLVDSRTGFLITIIADNTIKNYDILQVLCGSENVIGN